MNFTSLASDLSINTLEYLGHTKLEELERESHNLLHIKLEKNRIEQVSVHITVHCFLTVRHNTRS